MMIMTTTMTLMSTRAVVGFALGLRSWPTTTSNNRAAFASFGTRHPLQQQQHRQFHVLLASASSGGGGERSFTNQKLHNNHNNNSTRVQNQKNWQQYSHQKPPLPTKRRPFSTQDITWVVPKSIDIPEDKLELSFVRSSGAGGQNVNKVNTQVVLRFKVLEADWLPLEVRQRLVQQQQGRINKSGYLTLQVQEHRTQEQNRKAALAKLKQMILEAWPRPKERKMRKGISKKAKERNKEFKRRRSQVKQGRKAVSSKDW